MKSNESLVIRTVRLYHTGTADLHDFLENFLKMLQYHIDIWLHDHTLSIKCYSSRSGIAWTIPSVCSFDTLVDKAKKLLFPASASMCWMWKQAIRKGWRKAEPYGCVGITTNYNAGRICEYWLNCQPSSCPRLDEPTFVVLFLAPMKNSLAWL